MLYDADRSAGALIPDKDSRNAILSRLLHVLRKNPSGFPEYICEIESKKSKYHSKGYSRFILRVAPSSERGLPGFPVEASFSLSPGSDLAVSVVEGSGMLVLQNSVRLTVLDAGERRDGLVFLLSRAMGQATGQQGQGRGDIYTPM